MALSTAAVLRVLFFFIDSSVALHVSGESSEHGELARQRNTLTQLYALNRRQETAPPRRARGKTAP
jgi:hypothetical protein